MPRLHQSASRLIRVAIIGSGPAAFYAAEALLKHPDVQVDMLERLPTPYGLVRGGVAPDHQKIKSVIAIYQKIAAHPGFRYFGNLEYGRDLHRADLESHFHAILYATGAQTDRRLGIPGEDLKGSHSATEFVAWYNGHPDFRDRVFDLSCEGAAVIGMGNVAVDVARILCLTPEHLKTTDMADEAIAALEKSRVREVHMLGRRGVVQAAFTTVEVKELGELEAADVIVDADECALDAASAEELAAGRATVKAKVDIVQGFAKKTREGKPRRLHIRFCVSPIEILGDDQGRVRGLRLVKNRLVRDESGVRAEPTGEIDDLEVGIVFRSVGYKGVPLPELPFDERRGTLPHEKGRVFDPITRAPLRGHYVTGWIKRGPSGVIGNNKADSVETVNALIEDAGKGALLAPPHPEPQDFEACARARQPNLVTFADWRQIDRLEMERGVPQGRPRVKLTTIDEMLGAIPRD
ncbi:MAG: NADP oxidoreductase [Candidatus Eisenbacteria bacterium]|uniref:NADP oxidoreductase n=1 Tax=Eiseniibacteriota bacterium TaxID=2212470 RepID=A0A538U9W4_UNCEI|nr:MAG: NADP oxidoreductase [Candidatus Eisenbacteria bacterium]